MGVMERVIPLHFTTERTSRGLAIGDPLAAKPPGRLPARAPQFNPDPFGRTRAHTGTRSISLPLLGWPTSARNRMVASIDPTLEIAIEPMFALPSTHEMRNASDRCTCLRSSGSTRAVQQINGCCTTAAISNGTRIGRRARSTCAELRIKSLLLDGNPSECRTDRSLLYCVHAGRFRSCSKRVSRRTSRTVQQ